MNIDFKDEFTNSILNSMIQDLDEEQMSKLKNVLYMNINNYTIDKASTELIVYDKYKNNEVLQTFLNTKLLEGKSPKTIERYHDIILPMLFEINKDIKEITTWDLRSYLSNYKIKRGVCDNTLDGMRRIYSSFFGWLKKEEYIEKDPSERLQKIKAEKKVKTIISDEQFEILKMNCEYTRDIALLNLLWCSGMRVGEIYLLNISDINLEKCSIIVKGKGNKQREVYFNGATKVWIDKYLSERKDNNPALFVTLRNGIHKNEPDRLSIKAIETRLKKIANKSGIEGIHPHKFRRTMASSMARRNISIDKIAKLLGHEKISTTQDYLVKNQNDIENSYKFCF